MKFLNSDQQIRDICKLEWLGNESNQEHINISLAKGIIFVEIGLARGIILTKIGLANSTILKLWEAHPYLKFSQETPSPCGHKQNAKNPLL